jgi:hypothetical protein
VFPLLSAPFVAAWGLRGAYVLPLIGFVVLLPLAAAIRRQSGIEAPLWLLIAMTVAANPLFFYALEFWEHTPAAALLAAATAVCFANANRNRSGLHGVLAGALAGGAIALRPEALWYALTLFVISARSVKQFAAIGAGLALALGPFAVVNYVHSGNPVGPHMAANLAPLSSEWAATRWSFLQSWFGPSSMLAGLGLVVIGISHLVKLFGARVGTCQIIALCGVAMTGFAAAGGDVPRETMWNAWPLFGVLLVPGLNRRQPLWLLAAVPMILIVLTSPHDGGAQWGPRFLLIATPALVVLAAVAVHQVHTATEWRGARVVLLALILLCSVYVSRNAFRELRGAKQYYSRVVAAAEAAIPANGYALTNVWWFDQIVAPLYQRRTILFAGSEPDYRQAIDELAKAGVGTFTLVSSREDASAAQTRLWMQNTCIRITAQTSIPERLLDFDRATCAQ